MLEYGVESCYDKTLRRINRGHTWEQARDMIIRTAERGLHTGIHIIFGLPGETRVQMLEQAQILSGLPVTSLKLHQLQIVKGTAIEKEFASQPGDFVTFSLNEYIDFVIDFLELLNPEIYVERIVGEVPPRFVNNCPWGLIRNVEILRLLDVRLEERDTFQGARYIGREKEQAPPGC